MASEARRTAALAAKEALSSIMWTAVLDRSTWVALGRLVPISATCVALDANLCDAATRPALLIDVALIMDRLPDAATQTMPAVKEWAAEWLAFDRVGGNDGDLRTSPRRAIFEA